MAFISPHNGMEYAERLAMQIPGASAQAAYGTGGRLRGYVVTDLQVNTTMDISLSHGIKDLWNSPSRIILLLCGAGIIMFYWMAKRQASNKISETP